MFEGRICHYLSATEDENIGRRYMGNRTIEEFVADIRFDAASPEQLDALAFQFLCQARRVKTAGFLDAAARWKREWRRLSQDAVDARVRLARHPTRETHPGFFDQRSAGRPGHLYDDLFLPHVFRLDLSGIASGTVSTGLYSPPLRHGETYRVKATRDCKAWVQPTVGDAVAVGCQIVRGLMALGRVEALPLSAMPMARAA